MKYSILIIFISLNSICLAQTNSSPKQNLIAVDNYKVTNNMFKEQSANYSMDSVWSIDKAWFKNDELNESLVFELYTDYHRLIIFHFSNSKLPLSLVKNIQLHLEDGNTSEAAFNGVYVPKFVEQSQIIDKSFFSSTKGFQLGDPTSKALEIYGPPQKREIEEDILLLKWEFQGDQFFREVRDTKEKIAIDSFGYKVTMYFKNDILVGQILYNNIP